MVDLLIRGNRIPTVRREEVVKALMEREALGSTGIGQGVAIPHAKVEATKDIVGALGLSSPGIPFDSADHAPAHIFFLLLAPRNSAEAHLKALARISRLLKEPDFKNQLQKSKSSLEVVQLIQKEDV